MTTVFARSRAFVALLGLLLNSCFAGASLRTGPASPADVRETYTLYLYGCHYPDDIMNMAFLVPRDGRYTFEIYDLPTSYQVRRNIDGQQARKEAESFVTCSAHRVSQTQIRRVTDAAGGTVAFEIRPLYFPLEFGRLDVLLVNYEIRDSTVRTYIRLYPDVERVLESPGPDSVTDP